VLWVALWDDISVANIVGGVVVAAFVVVVAHLDRIERPEPHFHPLLASWYIVQLGWQLALASVRLAWEILTPGQGTYTGIIAVPMRGGSDDVVTLVANSITLTPGTLTVDVTRDDAGATLYVHGMYTRDVEAVRRDVLKLESLALRAFGSDEDAARVEDDFRNQAEVVCTEHEEES
ncbi:MAG: Na+/H+ antiporter subunit E, partial [Ilumatobacteraceae bacterium]